jgi:hypothetical protein
MGTSLIAIGNHKIDFKNRSYRDIACEIIACLNKISFVNKKYLKNYTSVNIGIPLNCIKDGDWYFPEENEYFSFNEEKKIDIYGAFGLDFSVSEFFVKYNAPSFRYSEWMEMQDIDGNPDVLRRNEWRKFFFQVQKAFGGDRVIYLADNCHHLDGFDELDVPFFEIETTLLKQFGSPALSMYDAYKNNSYFIDKLNDILWEINIENYCGYAFIGDFIFKCLLNKQFRANFSSILNDLGKNYKGSKADGNGFFFELLQIEYIVDYFRGKKHLVPYVAHKIPMVSIISFKNDKCSLTVFYHPYDKIFSIIENKIIVDESHFDGSVRRVFVLSGTNRHYLYNDKSSFLQIEGKEITLIKDSLKTFPTFIFVVVLSDDAKYIIYNNSLKPIIQDVDSYEICANFYCIAKKGSLNYLLNSKTGSFINIGFVSYQYFHHSNCLNNNLHYFIVKNEFDKYALCHLKKNILWNDFDWDDYKAEDSYSYLFFKKANDWYKINFFSLKFEKVNEPKFDK